MESNVVPIILKFAAKFLQEMDQTKSVVASPLSAEFTLALAALAATGAAHEELLKGLGFPDNNSILTSFIFLSVSLKSLECLTLANKIYLQEGLELLPKVKKYAEFLKIEFGNVNFADSKRTSDEINNWVEQKTNGKIREIYTSDGSEQDAGLVLLNAIYFKGSWLHHFDPEDTQFAPFRVNSTKVISVPMMKYRKHEKFMHGSSEDLQAYMLILQYRESNNKMVIILPYQLDGLNDVIKKLAEGYDLLSNFRNMRTRKIRIALPKFKIETIIELKDVLKTLGMTAMFKDGFNKILSENRPLNISKAIQKASIDVNKVGTEAAAASMPMFVKLSMPPSFQANHPFAYIIFGRGDIPIFVGTYRGDETAPISSIEEFNERWL